jgi:hypothetical protein
MSSAFNPAHRSTVDHEDLDALRRADLACELQTSDHGPSTIENDRADRDSVTDVATDCVPNDCDLADHTGRDKLRMQLGRAALRAPDAGRKSLPVASLAGCDLDTPHDPTSRTAAFAHAP